MTAQETEPNREPAVPGELLPVIYNELRGLAERYLRREPRGHTLQPTALVHEAYLRIVEITGIDWRDSVHFFTAAAGAMRRVLVDHARRKGADRRGQGRQRVTLNEEHLPGGQSDVDVLELDEALSALAKLNERHARIVELRFFGGLAIPEVATALGVSETTVAMDWRIARAWLNDRLTA